MTNTHNREHLVSELKDLIITSTNLTHIPSSEIQEQTPLYKEGLGLDSIDLLEIIVAVENKYNLKIQSAEDGQKYFKSIGTIANLIIDSKSEI